MLLLEKSEASLTIQTWIEVHIACSHGCSHVNKILHPN